MRRVIARVKRKPETKRAMPEKWTGDVVGVMHTHRLKMDELAAVLGWHPKYLSAVINGHRRPAGAEAKVKAALSELLREEAD